MADSRPAIQERLDALTDYETSLALELLAGHHPETLTAVLDQVDDDRRHRAIREAMQPHRWVSNKTIPTLRTCWLYVDGVPCLRFHDNPLHHADQPERTSRGNL